MMTGRAILASRNGMDWRTGGLVAASFILCVFIWNFWSRAQLASLGILAGASVLLMFRYPIVGIALVGFTITSGISEFLPGVMSPILLMVLVLVVIRKLLSGDFRWRWNMFLWMTAVFVVWIHFTGIWADRLDLLLLGEIYRTMLLAFIVTEVVDSPHDLATVLLVMMLGACFSCVVALKSFVDFFTGGAAAQVAVSAVDVTKARFAGHWVDPNYLSTSMVCYLAPSIALWRSKLSKVIRYFAFVATILICSIVIITISRTGMIAAFCVVVMMVAVQRRRLLLGVSLAALFIVLLLLTPFDVVGRLMNTSFDASSGERSKLLEAGWNMFLRDPVFGSGLGTLRINMTNEFPHNHTTISAHNNYLDVAAEAGLIGLGLLIAVLVIIGRFFNWRDWTPANEDLHRGLSQSLRASFVVVLISFATFTTYLYAPYWMVFILASTLPVMEKSPSVRTLSLGSG